MKPRSTSGRSPGRPAGLWLGVSLLLAGLFASGFAAETGALGLQARLNQAGFAPGEPKTAILFAETPASPHLRIVDPSSGKVVLRPRLRPLPGARWGRIGWHAEADFSRVRQPGRYALCDRTNTLAAFAVAPGIHALLAGQLLGFLRQQRCGYNPWLGALCHPSDGRTAYGPLPPGTAVDARGGWHDAADLLKYLLTSGNTTAQLLLAGRVQGKRAEDAVDNRGQPGPNGLPDVLDEARWGLEWLLKLHPEPGQLYHQVADDRDHCGWRLPHDERADYGWGPGGARVVYAADGQPQGLKNYRSESTGLANLAGRYAAAMALAWQTWRDHPALAPFAQRCLQAGVEVYALGRRHEGVQQGNSFGAPYRYAETTWADDMEWGAAELYRATRDPAYLQDAIRYARLAAATSWMGQTEFAHYQYYPFFNYGHYSLHEFADAALKQELAGYYRAGLERCRAAAARHPYGIGVPFVWCSNNLVVALVTQGLLYQRMTGDHRFQPLVSAHLDWLLGRNPWGCSMFTGLPEGGTSPRHPHLMTTRLTGRLVRGGLVDGPVAERIFKALKGVELAEPDPLAAFQAPEAVYHDDLLDYSTNEPTLDGTASAVLMFALLGGEP